MDTTQSEVEAVDLTPTHRAASLCGWRELQPDLWESPNGERWAPTGHYEPEFVRVQK